MTENENINADTEKKTMHGYVNTIIHDGVEICHHVGYDFLVFILENHTDTIIRFVNPYSIQGFYYFFQILYVLYNI
jgi:hypothetical protein